MSSKKNKKTILIIGLIIVVIIIAGQQKMIKKEGVYNEHGTQGSCEDEQYSDFLRYDSDDCLSECFKATEQVMKCVDYHSIRHEQVNWDEVTSATMDYLHATKGDEGYKLSWLAHGPYPYPNTDFWTFWYRSRSSGGIRWYDSCLPYYSSKDLDYEAFACAMGEQTMHAYPACVDDADCNAGEYCVMPVCASGIDCQLTSETLKCKSSVDCPTLRANALSSITSWSGNPTSTLKNSALSAITNWASVC